MIERNTVLHGDCLEIMADMPAQSIDAIITDPPYGIKLDKWDNPIDIKQFIQQSQRVLTDDGFLAFFCQMPTMIDWCNQANQYFKFSTHITWLKRNTIPSNNLSKTHESIMIYRKKRAKFYCVKGKYSDLKVAALAF